MKRKPPAEKICRICGRTVGPGGARGLCARHYKQQQLGKRPLGLDKEPIGPSRVMVSFYVPKQAKALVVKEAQRQGRRPSEIWRQAVAEFVARLSRR